MKALEKSSATIKRAFVNYMLSLNSELNHVYKRWSKNKYDIVIKIRSERLNKKGYRFRIISYNNYYFTAGFIYEENGNKVFAYFTPSKTIYRTVSQDTIRKVKEGKYNV